MADFQTKTSYMNCLWYQIETLKTFMFYTHDSPTFFLVPQSSRVVGTKKKNDLLCVLCVCVFSCVGQKCNTHF